VLISIDPGSAVAPYEQLREQISTMATSGVLAHGQRLPTIRQLAIDLGLAAGTVARAYRELESADIIETRGRHGTFVAEHVPTVPARERNRALAAAAEAFAVRARQLGIDHARAIAQVQQTIAAMGDPAPQE
jgi:DNA-binding transcriptional regulator YhcF (GntR family)